MLTLFDKLCVETQPACGKRTKAALQEPLSNGLASLNRNALIVEP